MMTLLRDPAAAGLYACDHDLDSWSAAARGAGLLVMQVDLEFCGTKGAILDAFADACGLPEYFGGNWDALDECLRDDSWHEPPDAARHGILWRIDGAALAAREVPDAFETLVEILDDAVESWRERGVACWILVATDEPAEFGLDPLPGGGGADGAG
jgi:hypothetical protein